MPKRKIKYVIDSIMEPFGNDATITFNLNLPFWKKNINICSKVQELGDIYEVQNECELTWKNILFTRYKIQLKGTKKNIKFVIGLI